MPRRSTFRTTLAVLLVAVLAAAAGACARSSSGAGTGTTEATNGAGASRDGPPYAITRTTVTLNDTTRPTEAGTKTPEHPGRTLVTDVYVPHGAGPFPLVVFAHGVSGHPDKVGELLTAWATAGYVVAAPAFPLTNQRVDGGGGNWRNVAAQPGDVSFLLDTLLGTGGDHDGLATLDGQLDGQSDAQPEAQPGRPGSSITQRIDPDRIGVAGHSLGGATVYGVVFNSCCRDDRIKAAEILSGVQLPVGVPPAGEFHLDGHVPLLLMHGEADTTLPFHLATDVYATARPPVWLVDPGRRPPLPALRGRAQPMGRDGGHDHHRLLGRDPRRGRRRHGPLRSRRRRARTRHPPTQGGLSRAGCSGPGGPGRTPADRGTGPDAG